jgi:hypothetical protein
MTPAVAKRGDAHPMSSARLAHVARRFGNHQDDNLG